MDFQFPPRFPRTVAVAHAMLAPRIANGDTVVDATAGNGHDTAFLAECVGDGGCVISIDLQPTAIDATRTHCENLGLIDRVNLVQDSHENITDILLRQNVESVSAVVFNLGYLPGGDKSIVTHPDSTLSALEQSLKYLRLHGLLHIVCYPGHPEGAIESHAVTAWASSLDETQFLVVNYQSLNQSKRPPFIIAIERRKH